jgi:hypothetical protein
MRTSHRISELALCTWLAALNICKRKMLGIDLLGVGELRWYIIYLIPRGTAKFIPSAPKRTYFFKNSLIITMLLQKLRQNRRRRWSKKDVDEDFGSEYTDFFF